MTSWAYCVYSHDDKETRVLMSHRFKAAPSSTGFPCGDIILFLSFQAVTQLELFGDMSTPPDITSPPVSMHCSSALHPSPFPSVAAWRREDGLWAKEGFTSVSCKLVGFTSVSCKLCDLGKLTSYSKPRFPLLLFKGVMIPASVLRSETMHEQ